MFLILIFYAMFSIFEKLNSNKMKYAIIFFLIINFLIIRQLSAQNSSLQFSAFTALFSPKGKDGLQNQCSIR